METMTETENMIATPAAARDFVKKAADAAKERATTFHANAEKATANVEQTLVNAVGEVAKLTRHAQQAAYEDAEAFFSGVGKLAAAQSFGEAVQIYSDYLRARADVATQRTRAASDYVGKLLADGAKTVQENVAKANVFAQKAA
jgi:phasin